MPSPNPSSKIDLLPAARASVTPIMSQCVAMPHPSRLLRRTGFDAPSNIRVATPPSGIVTAPIIGRGHFTDDVRMKLKIKHHGTKPVVVSMEDPSEVVAQQITLAPGGHTGWHTHPGPAVVVVSRGHDPDDGRSGVLHSQLQHW